jgi:hypothetical protein
VNNELERKMKQEADRLLEEKRQATARDVKIQEEMEALK